MDALASESHTKDLRIAELKAEAFELRQKVRDYQALHERYSGLEMKFNSMVGFEGTRQQEMQSQLYFSTTANQTLVREVEELQGIKKEQLLRLQRTDKDMSLTAKKSDDLLTQV